MLQVSTPFFGLGQALPAEMFRGAKEKVRFSDPPQVSFSDLEKLPADKLLERRRDRVERVGGCCIFVQGGELKGNKKLKIK